jgi:hypothetical protein
MSIPRGKWTTLSQVKSTLAKKWSSGAVLKDFIESADLFPFRIPLRGPGPNDLSRQFDLARKWVQQFRNAGTTQPFRVEWQQTDYRILGRNELPVSVVFESRENLLRYINRTSDFRLFAESAGKVLAAFPVLKEWILKHPFAVIRYSADLKRLIRVAVWMKTTPKPGLYLRQLSLPDIDTKFLETHKKILAEWFDHILDPLVIDRTATGVKGFERRYGFLEKPALVRFRILDRKLYLNGFSDLAVRADEFCTFDPDIETVFVTENDINGLAFPMVDKSIIIFGRGYGFEYLHNAHWLKNKRILYWGDIDTHGFAILSQFRKLFPTAASFLMDRNTLLAHDRHLVREATPSEAIPGNLTDEENALYNDLRSQFFGESVRLEQEFIPFDYVERYVNTIGNM